MSTDPTAGGVPLPTSRETAEGSDGLERGDLASRDKALDEWMDGALKQDGYVAQPDSPLMTCLTCGSTVHMGAVALHDGWHDHLPGSIRNLNLPGINEAHSRKARETKG